MLTPFFIISITLDIYLLLYLLRYADMLHAMITPLLHTCHYYIIEITDAILRHYIMSHYLFTPHLDAIIIIDDAYALC